MFSGNYQLELTRPAFLGCSVVLLWIAYFYYRSLIDLRRWQRITSIAIRILVIGMLVLALAGLNLLRPTRQQFVVVAVDESLSVDEQSRQRIQQYLTEIQSASTDHKVVLLPFAAAPGEVSEQFTWRTAKTETMDGSAGTSPNKTANQETANPTEFSDAESTEDVDAKMRLGTNLAAAIEASVAALPPFFVPQIFLISDGNQTEGEAVTAALAAEVPIHTISLPTRSEPEVQISEVVVPAEVRQGEPFDVEVVIDSNHDDEGIIEIYRGDVRIGSQQAKTYQIKKGENRFRFRQESADQRLMNYSARISGFNDKLLDNNLAFGLISTSGKPRVLLVDSDTSTTDHLRWSFARAGYSRGRPSSRWNSRYLGRSAKLRSDHVVERAGHRAYDTPDGIDSGVCARLRWWLGDDRRRPVVWIGRLLQDDTRRGLAGAL